MRWRYSALGFATACWGTAAAATKLGLSAFRPATQLLVELLFATGVLWLPVIAIGRRPRIGSLRTYALLAFLDPALPFLLILIGLRSSTAANAALLVSLESFVAVGFAVVIGTERVTRVFATGAVLDVAGALLVSSSGTSAFALGDLLFLAATVPGDRPPLLVTEKTVGTYLERAFRELELNTGDSFQTCRRVPLDLLTPASRRHSAAASGTPGRMLGIDVRGSARCAPGRQGAAWASCTRRKKRRPPNVRHARIHI
jgi:uncharacterized membrane protein